MKSKDIDKRKMKLEDVAAPLFKGPPRIHKQGISLRPIVSGFKTPTRGLVDWLKNHVPSTSKISVGWEMPGKVKVRIVAGKCLPVMDRARDTCDAFVELSVHQVKLGATIYKTDVYRHSLNPQWHSEWYRFEQGDLLQADDEELQDEPLQIRVMDYDTYSANDAIGKVYIDLNPLLTSGARSSFTGWFPIYDTMHGLRGEINVQVKVELFSDSNKYRESSCGVQFFYSKYIYFLNEILLNLHERTPQYKGQFVARCPLERGHGIPQGYWAQSILGFVEELVVNDDPEYQWIDKIRTPRASNEARQTLFSKLSGVGLPEVMMTWEVQRKIGLKALDLGGNAVVGHDGMRYISRYQQCFDLEGESGIVVRGIGTAVVLAKTSESTSPNSAPEPRDLSSLVVTSRPPPPLRRVASFTSPFHGRPSSPSLLKRCVSPTKRASSSHLPKANSEVFATTPPLPSDSIKFRSPVIDEAVVMGPSPLANFSSSGGGQKYSSDSDLSTTPKGCGPGSTGSGGAGFKSNVKLPQESMSLLEYPFITMKIFPPGFIQHIAGVVTAKSVKIFGQINNPDEPETRDAWWIELRKEIRSHAKALGCSVVLGYSESTNIW
ncbi:C2CD5 [Cordylochernes scorpioides]|uniref:C2CD5 n=1 Tax=Cordylochernes scorpioides TaxID=51811 RepID=A0ABY6JVI1_9ARAC|nr:C2CD5 [Cordylochernes scorpioides]